MKNTGEQAQDILQSFIIAGTPEEIRERYAALPDIAAVSDFGELDRDIVVIDTETTGFSFNHDELTQIAAARMVDGQITDWYITFVNPGQPIPEDVVHLTDIRDEDVADAPTPSEALAGLVAFVGNSKLVAHNAAFDRTFTTRHVSGYPLLENIWIDSLDLARIALPRLKSHRLLDIVQAFGAPPSTHRADADVAATCCILRILFAAVKAMPQELVQEIAQMATAEEWPTQVVFDHFVSRETFQRKTMAIPETHCSLAEGNESPESESNGLLKAAASSSALSIPQLGEQAELFATGTRKHKPFSLRELRRARIDLVDYKPKTDADVVAEEVAQGLVFPTSEKVSHAFSAEGIVGSLYDDFEVRSEQLDMAQAVRSAFERSENLMVEAGTGVGKSMAYLVPAALTARANGISMGVATKTNALLDQLIYQELPALGCSLASAQALGNGNVTGIDNGTSLSAPELEPGEQTKAQDPADSPLTFAALKGFSHYPCLRKIGHIVAGGPRTRLVAGKEQTQAPALAALLSYIEQTEYDDIDSLKIDFRTLPRFAITTTSHDCLRRKCPYFGTSCFVHGARRRAEAADIVVTNHSLLFCDIAADGGLLPPIRYWVVDEAHGAEVEARRAFSLTIAAEDILHLASRVSSEDGGRNVFARAERRVIVPANGEGATLFYILTAKARVAGNLYSEAAHEFAAHMKDLLFFDTNKRGRNYETVELWLNDDIRQSDTFAAVALLGKTMAQSAEKLITACQDLVAYLEDAEGAAEVQREIASIAIELKDLLNAVEIVLDKAPDGYAYSATLARKKDKATEKLEALLLNVGDKLNETFYANTHSVIFASATLVVNNKFDAFEHAMGLNESENSHCKTCFLESSYDFDANMTVFVASDMPEPNEAAYMEKLQQLLISAHRAQRGSLLTLFTNRREMEQCFDVVQPELKLDNLRLVCQKWGVSVKGLRDDFLADKSLSLFALKSFWEGFDAPGSTLRGVVIPKLPFAKPTDPLSCERAARDDQAWRRYVLPQAVLETKQAAGRLIRKATDRGVLILADHRLLSKGYGKAFLNSLPSKNIKVRTCAEIAEELAQLAEEHTRVQLSPGNSSEEEGGSEQPATSQANNVSRETFESPKLSGPGSGL